MHAINSQIPENIKMMKFYLGACMLELNVCGQEMQCMYMQLIESLIVTSHTLYNVFCRDMKVLLILIISCFSKRKYCTPLILKIIHGGKLAWEVIR